MDVVLLWTGPKCHGSRGHGIKMNQAERFAHGTASIWHPMASSPVRSDSVGCRRSNCLCTICKPVLPSKAALNLPDRLSVPCRKGLGKIPMKTRVFRLSGLFVILALTHSFAASAQSRNDEESAVQDAYRAYVQA